MRERIMMNNNKKYDCIIVGAGFYGAVLAERLHASGKTVLILERRNHIGGNCYSYDFEDTNITIHNYGTHIFHTNKGMVWEYINRFSEFNRYQHRVLTTHKNHVFVMPINLGTINAYYSVNLKPHEVQTFLEKRREFIEEPQNFEEQAINHIGRELYEAFIKEYTMKQWGCDPRELPASIINRLPVRTSYHDSYFDDTYQGLPINGYTPIFERMLKGIPIELNVDFCDDKEYWARRANIVIYTGPIDRYFDYTFGPLKWRSVRFEIERVEIPDFQGTSVMNYADLDVPYTRIHEHKHLHLERDNMSVSSTVIVREYPQSNANDPYYPVNSESDKELLARYQEQAANEKGVTFGGRLAEYRYYDMDQVIARALQMFQQLIGEKG